MFEMNPDEPLGKRLKCFASVEMLDMSEVLQKILIKYSANDEHKQADYDGRLSNIDKRALFDLKVFVKKYLKKNRRTTEVNETLSRKLFDAVDFNILMSSLRASQFYETRLLGTQDFVDKHISAVCGACISKVEPMRTAEEEVVAKKVSEHASSMTGNHEMTIATQEPVRADPSCRYCGCALPDGLLTCDECRGFLNDICTNLDRLENAVCIKIPTCLTSDPISLGSDNLLSIPSSWCMACKIFHFVTLGFRPNKSQKRKSRNAVILHYLSTTRLSQPSLACWARCRRSVEYFAHRLHSPFDIQECDQKDSELASFLDRLWCRVLVNTRASKVNGTAFVPEMADEDAAMTPKTYDSSRSLETLPMLHEGEDLEDQPCRICFRGCSDVYIITLGPGSTVKQSEIRACGACVLRCRTAAVRVAEQFSDTESDALSEWYSTLAKGDSDFLFLCECSNAGSKCDFCYLAECITLFYNQLKSDVNTENNTYEGPAESKLIALGSPLFFVCCPPLPGRLSKDVELYSRLIKKGLQEADQPYCVLCRSKSTDLFRLANNTVICQDCVLGYKAILILLKEQQGSSSDLVLLAKLVALPCHPNVNHGFAEVPLWAVCLPCHARRCLRLLHPLEPCLSLPQWLKRRARLVLYHTSAFDKAVTLCDLDPTISILKKKYKGSNCYCITKTPVLLERFEQKVEKFAIPHPLIFPECDEQNSLPNDSTSSCASSSLRALSESESDLESDHEPKREVAQPEISVSEPISVSSQTTLRDRRSRRLTARYAQALEEQTRRRRQRESDGRTLRSPGSKTALRTDEEDDDSRKRREEEPSQPNRDAQTSRPPKRSRPSGSPDKIIEGKRKPKANLRLQGDFATLGPQGRWESGDKTYMNIEDSRSDISSSTLSVNGPNRRQQRRPQPSVLQNRGGPRVKVVDRKTPQGLQCNNPMSVMKHAARLAAVGAQTQDGTSPLMAATAATAEAYFSDGSSVEGSNRLKPDCGNCAACRGMVGPCGRCHNCRRQAHYGSGGSGVRNIPCIETICHRRRHLATARGDGPRVKIPVNFSARSYQQAQKAMRHVPPPPGPSPQPSLLDTVPGLQEQLMNISRNGVVSTLSSSNHTTSVAVGSMSSNSLRIEPNASSSINNLEVFADAPVRSLRGGDLGMYFAPHDSHNGEPTSHTIAPVEGEVIDGDIAYRGGFPVVTSSASAPPKEICYLCGSAGIDLRNCVSCAEPFHTFCDKQQTFSKDKDSFLCCNCIPCDVCTQTAVELRCSECLCGFHPGCLPDYAPAQLKERGKWVCPNCTRCVHCLVTPRDRQMAVCRVGNEDADMVPWSCDPARCAACAMAEAKGNVCPQCNRTYLEETVEMIECDSCHRWLHRACAKLSYDQYELIARAPPNQLRSFTIYCSPCKQNIAAHSNKTRTVDDDEKLRNLTRESLTERMNTLIEGCKVFPHDSAPSSSAQLSAPSFAPACPKGDEHIFSTMASPSEYVSHEPHLPQVDGLNDSLTGSPQSSHMSALSVNPAPCDAKPLLVPTKKTGRGALSSTWLDHSQLQPPPVYAKWLVERLNTEQWITPKNLSYLLLARLIARIDKTPASSYDYPQLRRLLSWLSNSIEALFPWLEASYTAKEVRALLRQGQGSLSSVVDFLRSVAELELYEFACPYVVAIIGMTRTRLVFQSYQLGAPRTLGFYRECIEQVHDHLMKYHADLEDCSRRFDEAQDVFIKQREVNAYCLNPKTLLEPTPESFEESDGEVAVENFQKELFFKWQRLLHHPNRRAVQKWLEGNESLYYFSLKSSWDILNEDYRDKMILLPSRSTVDLDESDSEIPDGREIRALPIETIIEEEQLLLNSSSEPRRCLLCARNTDNSIEDRLIYIGSDTWAHVNCALWSKEVFEEDSGQLTGLSAALCRGGRTRCLDCGNLGATVTCSNEKCGIVVHFPCAMRRRKPTSTRPVFTADRSFFCSLECHAEAKKVRFNEAIRLSRLRNLRRFYVGDEIDEREEAIKKDKRGIASLIAADQITEEEVQNIKTQIDCDLESPELKEMLVCRRVFVPSDCFITSMRGDGSLYSGGDTDTSEEDSDDTSDPCAKERPRQSVLSLAISPNTIEFVSYSLPASAFVVTIGALRIDRLGHIGEASDSLCRRGDRARPGYLCPIGYRARRIFWSTTIPNARESYILSVNQIQKPPLTSVLNTSFVDKSSLLPRRQPNDFQFVDQCDSSAKKAMPLSMLVPTSSGRIIPTPCSARNSISTAFDPHPNNPVGLPLIRFTYPHGMPSNRLPQKKNANPQQSSPPTPRKVVAPVPHTVDSISAVVSSRPLSPLRTVPVKVVETVKAPMSANTSESNGGGNSLAMACDYTVQKSLPSQGQSLIITAKAPLPSPQKFANIVSLPQKASTPRIVSAVSLPKSQFPRNPAMSKSVTVYSVPSSAEGGVATPISSWQPSSSIRIVEKRTSPKANITSPIFVEGKQPVNVVRCVAGGQMIAGSKTPHVSHQPVIIRQPECFVSTPPSTSHIRTIRVTRLTPQPSTPVVTKILPHTPGETSQTPVSKLSDAQLASQLDGIFSNIQSPRNLAIVRPSMGILQSSESVDQSSSEQHVIRIPQISQLDGINDRGDSSNFPRRYGNNAAFGGRMKRKWMVERESRLALSESVLKAKQAANDRLYQKEAALYANSFRLQFSTSPLGTSTPTPTSAWRQVVNAVLKLREENGVSHPIAQRINGWAQFGLSHRHVVFLLEQLPGAHICFRYRFRYHRYRINQMREKYTPPVPVHEGAARLMPYPRAKSATGRSQTRDPLDFLLCEANCAPQSCLPLDWPTEATDGPERATATSSSCIDAARQAASIVAASFNLSPRLHARTVEAAVTEATADIVEEAEDAAVAAAGRARNQLSLTYQLRNLVTNREARLRRVAVYPSRIHKRGLFALCSFRSEELICEYTGELIRNIICERREAKYRASGVDCYFFRIDTDWVIDATYAGNYARFINHSCQPNCDAKILTMGDSSHIVIIAKRRILPGEELTYDYRFPKEADKLLCNCGRIGCRKYLN